jgi:HlyD family secretion protein
VLLTLLSLLVVALGAGVTWKLKQGGKGNELANLIVETVKRAALEISITERGSLESAANMTLVCQVEGDAGTGILKIVDEGTRAVKDQVLVELDSSRLRDLATAQEIVKEQAEAAMKTAEKNVEIQKTQNETDISNAKLKWDLAVLDLEKYELGDYIQETNTINGEIRLAQEDLTRYEEKFNFTKRLIEKGYATQTELEADRIAKEKAKIAVAVANEKLKVLQEYTRRRQMEEKKANKREFEREWERVKLRAQASLTQYEADFRAKTLTFKVEKEKHEKLLRQIELCIIKAPRDGLVVYANTRTGGRGGGTEPLIFEGAKVKERQAIINLPDIANMQVNARVHESKIDMVREGLPATVRVDAQPGEVFHGEVSMVSLVPMSGNWPNINLKEYVTFIKVTDEASKVIALKPGLTAEVEILIDRIESTLQAPITAFVERGGRHFAWIVANEKLVRREVKIGKSNELATQVLEDESLYARDQGLKEGEQVVLNPRTVLPKEVALLEEEIPPVAEANAFKQSDLPGKTPDRARGGRRGGPEGESGRRGTGSPGESAGDEPAGGGGGRGGRGGGMGDPNESFTRFDADKDGKLTDAEIPEQMKQFVTVAQLDTNKNNAIDKDEWLKFAEDMRQRRGGGGGRGGPREGRGAGAGGGQ